MNKIIKSIFVSPLLFMAFLSCSNKNDLQELRITYAPQNVNINVPATCYSFEFELIDVKRKKIHEKVFLLKFAHQVKELRKGTENNLSTKSVDVRIRCLLNFVNKVDTLCLGEFSGILLNGNLMQDNPALLNLLKSNIYTKHE